MLARIIVAVLLLLPHWVLASNFIDVTANEDGSKLSGQMEIWHDPENRHSLSEVEQALINGEFAPLRSAGSTGLKPGAFWSHFALRNVTDQTATLDLEYVDHQLIALDAYVKGSSDSQYQTVASMTMADPFSSRPVLHNRFVFKVSIPAGQALDVLVKFSSDQAGFVFPSMRIWSPDALAASHSLETTVIAFLFGGVFLMSVFALVGAIATQEKTFYAYSIYALSKIVGWGTILGYAHQFVLRDNFHWNLMSIFAALPILCGLVFARSFLRTRQHTPRLDYVLLFMMVNALFLILSAVFRQTGLAVLSATIALLLYPVLSVAGLVRWRQGSNEALVFALAWSLLVFGLVGQALRDLGLVSHNFTNYYWPAFASFVEMLGIMVALGIKVRRLRLQKEQAEHRYLQQLENSKAELEKVVSERTRELEEAKLVAEQEARTDALTGIHNRRSFFIEAGKRLNLARRKQYPLSLLMFDIDFFKSINDTFGHAMGDEALRVFSNTIVSALRETDIFGRLGGEEFALLLDEDKQGTLQTAERLRQAIGNIAMQTPNGELRLTASIGVAYLRGEADVETLINNADNALYQAKNKGRDQIIEHGES